MQNEQLNIIVHSENRWTLVNRTGWVTQPLRTGWVTQPLRFRTYANNYRHYDNVRCRDSMCALVLRVINAELIALTFCLTPPPPRLTYKKYYILQDGIDFRGFLPLLRLHALRFIRSVALQAIFLSRSGLRKPCTTTWRPVTRCQ